MDDLSLVLDRLSGEVARMKTSEEGISRDLQLMMIALTKAELALNDLERREACLGIPSREMAGRCVELLGRIRSMQTDVVRAARREREAAW